MSGFRVDPDTNSRRAEAGFGPAPGTSAYWYFVAISLGGGGLGLYLLLITGFPRADHVSLLFGLAFGLAELVQTVLPSGRGVSLGSAVVLVTLWSQGMIPAAWAIFLGMLVMRLVRPGPYLTTAFNVGQCLVSTAVAAVVFHGLGGNPSPSFQMGWWTAYAFSGLIYHLLNSLLTNVALAMVKRTPFLATWSDALGSAWRWVLSLGLATGILLLWERLGMVTGLAALWVLVLVPHFTFQRLARVLQEKALNHLMKLRREQGLSPERAEGLAVLAVAVADEMGLQAVERQQVRFAAFLYDLGTGDEAHPQKAADVVARLAVLADAGRVVRHCREQFDGSGSPDGLGGIAIPAGSRALAVAEAYLALVSPRSDGRALEKGQAINELRRGRGSRFDPGAVDALEGVLRFRRDQAVDRYLGRVEQELRDHLRFTARHLRRFVGIPGGTTPGGDLGALGDVYRHARGVAALYHLGRVINSSLSLEEVISRTLDVVEGLGYAHCCVSLLKNGELRVSAARGLLHGLEATPEPPGSLGSQASRLGEAAWTGNLPAAEPESAHRWRSLGLRSRVAAPVAARGKTIGVLSVFQVKAGGFEPDEVEALEVVASQAALAMENARLFSCVQRQLDEISSLKAFQEAVLDNIDNALVVVDREFQVQMANEAAAQLCQAAGKYPDGLVPGDSFLEFLRALKMNCEPWPGNLAEFCGSSDTVRELVGRRGTLTLRVQTSPLRDDRGEVSGCIFLIRDITETKRQEERYRQAERLAALGEVVAGAAHEIRNPLTAIKGFLQLLMEDLQERQNDYFSVVMDEIERIQRLVEDLLTTVRPGGSELVLVKTGNLVEGTVRLIAPKAQDQGVGIHLVTASDLPGVMGDPGQLRQVMFNLLANALEAMPDGGCLQVTTTWDRSRGLVQISVQDTGPGIPAGDKKRLFDPFFTTKERGTGLGLAVTLGIVHGHGGHMEVDNRPGGGAAFSVYLPAHVGERTEAEGYAAGGAE